jgi:hypothetical protein
MPACFVCTFLFEHFHEMFILVVHFTSLKCQERRPCLQTSAVLFASLNSHVKYLKVVLDVP